jgi:hypothetical protein
MQLKKTFTKYLLISAVVLLLINVAIDLVLKPKKRNENGNTELTSHQIDSVFLSVLSQYGIEDEWISIKKIKNPVEDSLSKQFVVKLPIDISIPLIIKDVNKIIENDITGFVSEEKKVFGTTEIRIYSNEILKMKATLTPDSSAVSNRNELCLIISDAYDLSKSDYKSFLSIPYMLCAVEIPGDDAVVKSDSLKKYSKEFIVLLNDDNRETKFRLDSGDQKELLKNSVLNIVSGFKNAVLISVDEQSKIFNSTVYNYVRDVFKKYNIKLVQAGEFIQIASDNDNEIISKFKYHCEDKTGDKQKIFFMTFDDFQKIRSELDRFRKKGNKIIPLSATNLVKQLELEKTQILKPKPESKKKKKK